MLITDNSAVIGTLATAVVQGDDLKDGTAEDGYISAANTNIDIWNNRSLKQTPYAISVTSNNLMNI